MIARLSQITRAVPGIDGSRAVIDLGILTCRKSQKLITVLAGSLVRFLYYEKAFCKDF
jgi:hypothetical protein